MTLEIIMIIVLAVLICGMMLGGAAPKTTIQLDTQKQYNRAQQLRLNGGSHTAEEWIELCTVYNNCCANCGQDDLPMIKDHIVPVSQGGTDDITNIQPMCRPCNSAKGTRKWRA